jgi:hypothetical protein
MTLDDVRTAIVNTFKDDAALKAMSVDVRAHRGRFTIEDLKIIAARPMSCLISFLSIRHAELQAGEVRCRCLFGAFVVTTDKPNVSRDSAALVISTRLLMLIPGNLFGLDISAPENIEAVNLYSGSLNDKGVALWAITWEQPVAFDVTDLNDDNVLHDFLTFHADYDLATMDEQIDASDDVTLPGPADEE